MRALIGLVLVMGGAQAQSWTHEDTPAPSSPSYASQPRDTSVRFNMEQNGQKMTADDFDAWMKARGLRVVGRANPSYSPQQVLHPVLAQPVAYPLHASYSPHVMGRNIQTQPTQRASTQAGSSFVVIEGTYQPNP